MCNKHLRQPSDEPAEVMQECKAVERLADLRLLPGFDDIKVCVTSTHVNKLLPQQCHDTHAGWMHG